MKIRWMMTAALLATMAGCPGTEGELPDVAIDVSADATVDITGDTTPDVAPDSADVPPDVAPDVDPDIVPDVDPDVDPDVVPDVDPDVDPDVVPDVDPDVDPDVVPDVDPDVDPDVVPDVDPDVDPDVVPDADPDVVADVDPDADPDTTADADVEPDVAAPVCGDNNVDTGETCDDGNTDDGDYCSADCQTVTGSCGDDVIQSNENCDGAETNGELCPDGITDAACDAACDFDYTACPEPAAGTVCAAPLDVVDGENAFVGTFDVDPSVDFSCDTDAATNVAWFAYTATSTGTVTIAVENATTTFAYTRLVVLDGLGCDPIDGELACEAPASKDASTNIAVVSGNSYLIAALSDGETFTMVDPTITIVPDVCGDSAITGGETCDSADLNGALCSDGTSEPTCDPTTCQLDISACPVISGAICETPEVVVDGVNTLTGTFDVDPTDGFSCDTTPTNVAWFEYTATATGTVTIQGENVTTTSAYTRLAVLDGLSCGPNDSELACVAPSSKIASTNIAVVEGNSYLIAMISDGEIYTMVDPIITITPDLCGDGAATGAEECDGADVAGATCLDGVTPLGCSASCTFDSSVCPTYPGDQCSNTLDVTAGPFPVTATGFFGDDFDDEFTCFIAANIVWFEYTAPSTGNFEVAVANATTDDAYSIVAVFDGAGCPDGNEVACEGVAATEGSTDVAMVMGNTYVVAFGTDDAQFSMVDPSIVITPIVCGDGVINGSEECDGAEVNGETCVDGVTPVTCSAECTIVTSTCPTYPGDLCSNTLDVTGGPFPVTATGFFGDDDRAEISCGTTTTNIVWFEYTAPSTGDFEITATNATTSNAYSRLAVFDGAGCPAGNELSCSTATGKTASDIVAMVTDTVYLIAFATDGDSFTMIEPAITITPIVCGDNVITGDEECDGTDVGGALCSDGITAAACTGTCTLDLSGCPVLDGSFCATPLDVLDGENAFTGNFDDDPADVFTCDGTPTNVAWFAYTATNTGELIVDVQNATTTAAYTRLAILDGLACDPIDAELACESPSSKNVSATVSVVSGESYMFAAITDGEDYTMVDPTITVTPIVCGDDVVSGSEECDGTDVGGALCEDGVTPATCSGTCTLDYSSCPVVPGSCDAPVALADGDSTYDSDDYTNSYTNTDYNGGGCSIFGSQSAPDVTFVVTVEAGETVDVTASPSFDAMMSFTTDCADVSMCIDTADDPETLSYTNNTASPVDIFVIVDGYNTGSGSFDINLTRTP